MVECDPYSNNSQYTYHINNFMKIKQKFSAQKENIEI